MPLDEPLFVIESSPKLDRMPHLLGVPENPGPEKLLLQSPEESLNAAVPFRRANERRARGDAEEAQLILEVVADVLASVVMANNEASGDLLGVDAEPLTDALPNRLECLETRGSPGRPRELEPHRQVTYQSLEPQHLVVGCSPFAGLQACLTGGKELVAPPGERCCRHAELT